jgi:hypothetical protein
MREAALQRTWATRKWDNYATPHAHPGHVWRPSNTSASGPGDWHSHGS